MPQSSSINGLSGIYSANIPMSSLFFIGPWVDHGGYLNILTAGQTQRNAIVEYACQPVAVAFP